MPNHPTHTQHLPGTKWTSAEGAFPHRHWEVAGLEAEEALLQAALDTTTVIRVPWRSLREREVWVPGWVSTR